MKVWFLEGLQGPRKRLQRIRITLPTFDVGRQTTLPLALDAKGISRLHARLELEDGARLYLTDLESTNGTFLNRERISERVEVAHGDIIHFAGAEFRAIVDEIPDFSETRKTTQASILLPDDLPGGAAKLEEMLEEQCVTAAFQPIMDLETGQFHAYEMLARGTHPDLPAAPGELFRIAESLGLEIRLSELMREVGISLAQASERTDRFFTNIHPMEMADPTRLREHVVALRERYPALQLVVEIHEAAVADRDVLGRFNAAMRDQGVGIAYDDFGVGQSRFMELADMPPDYVKLDSSLIRDPQLASEARQRMVEMIVDFARERGILIIAEGVSGEREAEYCRALRIDYAQGYHYGVPETQE